MNYKNILVPIDGSDNSYKALQEAMEIARLKYSSAFAILVGLPSCCSKTPTIRLASTERESVFNA